jgi:dienelactone hydrolase
MQGVLVYDETMSATRPGILLVHEWWGTNEFALAQSRRFAAEGYTVLVLDMYGQGKQAPDPATAGALSSQVMQNFSSIGKPRFLAALDFLRNHQTVDQQRLAAVGYCFGGGVVLNMARLGTPLKAVVSYHGSLSSAVGTTEKGRIQTKILVCHGGADKFVSREQFMNFKREMKQAGADYQIIVYPGAKHAFTNPEASALAAKFNLDIAYNARAAVQAWKDSVSFLKAALR